MDGLLMVKYANLMQELKQEHICYAESVLAQTVLNHPELVWPAVRQVSKAIIDLINTNQFRHNLSGEQIKEIETELYADEFYGKLSVTKEGLNPLEVIAASLSDSSLKLHQTMHVHAVFIHRIWDSLSVKSQMHLSSEAMILKKNKICQKIFYNKYFKGRSRINKHTNRLVDYSGTASASFFCNKMPRCEPHRRAKDQFSADITSDDYRGALDNSMSWVSGISGHTGSLLLGALLYGSLNAEQLKEYRLAIFAYLGSGGQHGFHECMIVGEVSDSTSLENHAGYEKFLPESFLISDQWRVLQRDCDSVFFDDKEERFCFSPTNNLG